MYSAGNIGGKMTPSIGSTNTSGPISKTSTQDPDTQLNKGF